MPFTIGGDWVSSSQPQKNNKPVRVQLAKRGNKVVTSIQNLNVSEAAKNELLSQIKRKWGCGGTIKDDTIEIQGDRVADVKELLAQKSLIK